ncbi:hypothetical protein [Streptomyces sp. NPDC048584]|uniref:hypothetical protein n=1 Tax=Streptomyces sp. NPDC048584 TaxID=3365573 RepID=UPI00371ECF42
MTEERPPSGRWTYLSWTPFAVIAVADVVAGPGVGPLPLVSLGPACAGLVGG